MRVRGWRQRLVINKQMESDMTEMCEQRKRRREAQTDNVIKNKEPWKHRLNYCGLVVYNIMGSKFGLAQKLVSDGRVSGEIHYWCPQRCCSYLPDSVCPNMQSDFVTCITPISAWSLCLYLLWADRSSNVWTVVCLQCCSPAVSDDQQCLGGYKGNRQHGCAGRWTKPVWVFSPTGLPPGNTSLLAQDHQRPTGQV